MSLFLGLLISKLLLGSIPRQKWQGPYKSLPWLVLVHCRLPYISSGYCHKHHSITVISWVSFCILEHSQNKSCRLLIFKYIVYFLNWSIVVLQSVFISPVQQSESAICIHISAPSWTPSPSYPSWSPQSMRWAPCATLPVCFLNSPWAWCWVTLFSSTSPGDITALHFQHFSCSWEFTSNLYSISQWLSSMLIFRVTCYFVV